MEITAAVIGTGAPWIDDEDRYAIGYHHGEAYRDISNVELIACADLEHSRATEFGQKFEIPDANCYTTHTALLEEHCPDVVSICVPPKFHAEVFKDCAAAGVSAVHCEKPMAGTWKECEEMASVARNTDIQLTFNHQRRFAEPFEVAKQELAAGRIGELQQIEFGGPNLYDYGTHSFDLCGHFVDDASPAWVLSQVHYTDENILFGEHNENQAVVVWEYDNGVQGLAATGKPTGGDVVGCHHRLRGDEGSIEIGVGFPERLDGPQLLIRDQTGEEVLYFDNIGLELSITNKSIKAAVEALESNTEPIHSVDNTLQSTSLIFGAWESARRRERIEFPLDIQDNPLREMVENGDLQPRG